MITINFSKHPAGKCFLVTSEDHKILRKLINHILLTIDHGRSMFKWNQMLEAWTIQNDNWEQDLLEEFFISDGNTITHIDMYTQDQIEEFHSSQVQSISSLYQESIQAAKDNDAERYIFLQKKVEDLSKPLLLTDAQFQKFNSLIPDEEICLSCESGCSPGHDYDHNCCFMQPGLTWEDAASEAQSHF